MQLNITTDYAIRTVVYLASVDRVAPAGEIAANIGISANYLNRVAAMLKKAGLVDSRNGATGGFLLAKKAQDISLFDIISVMESTTRLNRCLEPNHFCSRNATATCPVRRALTQVQTAVEQQLSAVHVSDLL